MIISLFVLALQSNAEKNYQVTEFMLNCDQNATLCKRHNYHQLSLPTDYDKNHSPGDIVFVEAGMFYNQLVYLDTASESFRNRLQNVTGVHFQRFSRQKRQLFFTLEMDR